MESHIASLSIISKQDTETHLKAYLLYASQDIIFVELISLVLGT